MKKYVKTFLKSMGIVILLSGSTPLSAWDSCICSWASCDPTIHYAMSKERKSLSDRLDDFIGVIGANVLQTKNQIKIIDEETAGYLRLQARIKKEAILLKKSAYLSKKILKVSEKRKP